MRMTFRNSMIAVTTIAVIMTGSSVDTWAFSSCDYNNGCPIYVQGVDVENGTPDGMYYDYEEDTLVIEDFNTEGDLSFAIENDEDSDCYDSDRIVDGLVYTEGDLNVRLEGESVYNTNEDVEDIGYGDVFHSEGELAVGGSGALVLASNSGDKRMITGDEYYDDDTYVDSGKTGVVKGQSKVNNGTDVKASQSSLGMPVNTTNAATNTAVPAYTATSAGNYKAGQDIPANAAVKKESSDKAKRSKTYFNKGFFVTLGLVFIGIAVFIIAMLKSDDPGAVLDRIFEEKEEHYV